MKTIEPFPVRRIAAVSAALLCAYFSGASFYHSIAQQDISGIGWGAPPPPADFFAEAVLAIPGILAGLPIILIGALTNSAWVTRTGVVLGATFFWYCVGWYIDCARLNTTEPPKIVVGYIKALRIASAIIFPFCILIGLRVGDHYCAVGVPPLWSELLICGILTFWVTLGTFFAWRRLRAHWKHRDQVVQLRIWP